MKTARWPKTVFALLTAVAATAHAQYVETTDGDLSNNGLAPTVLSFAPGSN